VLAGSLVRAAGPPVWPDLSPLSTYVPFLAWAFERVPALLLRALTLLALLIVVDDYTNGWKERRVLFAALLVAAGAVLGAPANGLSPSEWVPAALGAGLALLGIYVLLLRHDLLLVIPATGIALALSAAREATQANSIAAAVANTVGACIVLGCAWWLFQLLNEARTSDAAYGSPTGMPVSDALAEA
jgi:hypothetical protein